jgi:hypothetical protein
VIGILVIGDNHFIVRGPRPSHRTALALAREWSVIQIGSNTHSAPLARGQAGRPVLRSALAAWTISTREFRENLEWAIAIADEGLPSPAVAQLLDELRARGIEIETARADDPESAAR